MEFYQINIFVLNVSLNLVNLLIIRFFSNKKISMIHRKKVQKSERKMVKIYFFHQ